MMSPADARTTEGVTVMDDTLCEPVELIDADLDEVAGGFHINIGNFVSQFNESFNQTSTGNNNNGISGNQVFV
jgi:hypothetical protein